MSMTNHAVGIWTCTQVAWQFRFISIRRCVCKIPWPNGISKLDREFPSWSLRKSEESRARTAVDQEIEATSSLKDLINPKSITGKIFLIMKNWIWWWLQNWNGATILFIWSTKLPSVEPWQDKRAKNSCTERKTEESFQRKTIGSCSRRDAYSFVHTHATGDREDNVEWSGDTQEILTQSKHTLQYRKWRNRLTEKLEQSKGQSCD